ncbi:MAG TPA: glycosyltransferase [Acidimicrobiales bacterium]|nr:glycosyltransferase [Acidimicrobiales bacterium]
MTGRRRRARLRPLRRFAAVSGVVTAIDVSVLLGLTHGARVPVPAADGAAVGVASVASWLLHREVASTGDPFTRWVERPSAFVATAVLAGALDLAVVTAVAPAVPSRAVPVVRAKALALLVAGAARVLAYRAILVRPTRRGLAVRTSRADPPGELRLTVVVPAYGEGARIAGTVRRLDEALAGVDAHGGVEVLVVDDGSSDATATEAETAGARVLRLPLNQGKGAAVRAGVLAARGRTVAFMDADLSYPPEQVLRLLAGVESGWDVVVGSRHHAGSVDVARPGLVRSLSGRLFNLLTAVVLLGHYRDTQCGCKAFRSDVARLLFSRTKLDGFAFDVEVFHLVERYRLSLTEVPVTLVAAPGSTVRVGVDALRMVGDLFRLRRWSGRGAYDLRASDQPVMIANGDAAESARRSSQPR